MAVQIHQPAIKVSDTAGGQNLNAAAANNLVSWDTLAFNRSPDVFSYTPPSSIITILRSGLYQICSTLAYNTTFQQYNGRIKFRFAPPTAATPTVMPERGKSGYISNAGGHSESSLTLSTLVELTANSTIEVLVDRENAAFGPVPTNTGQSVFYVVGLWVIASQLPWHE